MRLIRFAFQFLFALTFLVSPMGQFSARAQGPDPFPRTVTDSADRHVTIPRPPRVIALIGSAPEVRAVVEAAALRRSDPLDDPAAFDWSGVGLVVLSDLFAAINPAWTNAAETRDIPVFLL